MIRLITFIGSILALTGMHVFGQETFNYHNDFKQILARTKDSKDELSYDKLLGRFRSNDTTLTDYEVLALLIGFTDKPQYKPYDDLTEERKVYALNDEGKYKEGLELANTFLATHPLSVKVLVEKSYAFNKLELKDSAQFYMYQAQRIFEAMYFSGSGIKKETPTFALGPADGQDYITRFLGQSIGIMGSGRDENGNFLDILEMKFDNGESGNLYFVIQHAVNRMFIGKSLEEEKKEKKKRKNEN
jgi:hypothetical protein